MSFSQKFVEEMVDNMTQKELSKYKSFDYEAKGLNANETLSDGTKVKVQDTNLDKISIFGGPLKSKNAEEPSQFISNPKFVRDGRLGYNTYVNPILDKAQEEFSRGV